MKLTKNYILQQVAAKQVDEKDALAMLTELMSVQQNDSEVTKRDIAIIGMACRFPEANNLQEFWDNLSVGRDCVGPIPDQRMPDIEALADDVLGHKNYSFAQMGYLEQVDQFDHAFFNISPAEARAMDPYQRIFLELAWEVIENAGYCSTMMQGSRTGIFLGYCDNESQYQRYLDKVDASSLAGNIAAIIASRISYYLNLTGPSQLINTSCSSSLTALHQACLAIHNKDCDRALVGGVNLSLFPIEQQTDFGILSPQRKTKAFDDTADGTVMGEGFGAILIKSYEQALKDGDYIHAVIKGTAINSDGRSSGITAPNAMAQSETLRMVWKRTGIDPETISYIEAHGTGTRLGDPIEIEGILHAFRSYTDKKQLCAIGSLKSNIGHTIAASGVAGVIKVALMLQHRLIPPTLHVTKPNTLIPFIESPVYINDILIPWGTNEGQPVRRAGVSAFGLSGTNVHTVLEEVSERVKPIRVHECKQPVFVLSAKNMTSLWAYIERYTAYLEMPNEHELLDLCATAGCGRDHFAYRVAIVANSKMELRKKMGSISASERDQDGWPLIVDSGIYYGHVIASGEMRPKVSNKSDADVLARDYVGGAEVDWLNYYQDSGWSRISLPTYPFLRTRHWVTNRRTSLMSIPVGDSDNELKLVSVDKRSDIDIHQVAQTTFAFGDALLAHTGFHQLQPKLLYEEETRYAALYFLQHFHSLGLFLDTNKQHTFDDLCQKVQLEVKYIRLLRYVLELLIEAGFVIHHGSDYAATNTDVFVDVDVEAVFSECLEKFPNNRSSLQLLRHCLLHYPEVLDGRISSHQVLYAEGNKQLLKSFVAQRKSLGSMCEFMAIETMAQYIRSLNRPVQILEVGGGNGGLTSLLLPQIKDAQIEYTFTDSESSSIKQAEQQFAAEFPNLRFKLLDTEQQPSVQGFRPHSYDVIIANNMLHATKDVRASLLVLNTLLADQGVLFGLVLTQNRASTNLIWGLDEEWWAYKDIELRVKSPLMDDHRWEKALQDTNYHSIQSYPSQISFRDSTETMLLIGQSRYKAQTYPDWTYQVVWKHKEFPQTSIRQLTGAWLLFMDGEGIGEALVDSLRSSGRNVCTVRAGDEFIQEDGESFTINPNNANEYRMLFNAIKHQHHELMGIVHLWSLSVPSYEFITPESLQVAQEYSTYSLFHLTQALIGINLEHAVDIRIITDRSQLLNDHKPIRPELAPIMGLAKVISQENPWLQCYCIDLSTAQWSIDQLALQVYQEIQFNREDTLVAYREGRLVPEMERSKLEALPELSIQIRTGGVYMLIGGAGKLGLHFAEHLANKAPITLVLINRTPLPPKEQWKEWSEHPECGDEEARKLKAMLQIELMGSTVIYYAADVSNREQMQVVIDHIYKHHGSIRGVLHCAMQQTFETIETKTFEDFKDGMKAKLFGTVILDSLIEPADLDFFVMFSSLASIWGGATASDYVASNSFLDAYSAFRRHYGKHALALNWYAFEEITGPGFIGYMPIDGALQAFDISLTRSTDQILIGKFDLDILRTWMPSLRMKLSEDIFHESTSNRKAEIQWDAHAAQVNLYGREEGEEYTPNEWVLGQIWSDVLGYSTFSIDDNFFTLGGDSLLAIGIVTRAARQITTDITITDLFFAPTIRQLAASIATSVEDEEVILIPAVGEAEYYEASTSQQRVYVLEQMQDGSVAYNVPTVLLLEGELHREQLEQSFKALIMRHEAFRTSFTIHDGVLQQHIIAEVDFHFAYVEVAEHVIQQEINRFIKPFDLTRAPLLRSALFRIAPDKHILMLDMHHIITDGVSINIIIRDFLALYHGEQLPPLRIQYKDYSVWQNRRLQSLVVAEQEQYWCAAMAGQLPALSLPTDFPRPRVKGFSGHVLSFEVDVELTNSVIHLGQERGATLYMTLLAALNIMLAKYSGDEDIIIGSPAAGRNSDELEDIVGLFLNTLPMRNYPRSERSVSDFLEEVKQHTLLALIHAEYPFEALVDRLSLSRDLSRNPLFDVMFIMQNTGDAKAMLNKLDSELRMLPYPYEQHSSQFDLTFDIIERNNRLHIDMEYSNELFSEETIRIMAGHYVATLNAMVQNPLQTIGEVLLLSSEEQSLLIEQGTPNKLELESEKTVVQLFEERVKLHPDQVAVQDGKRKLTYGQLNRIANQVARRLLAHGVNPDTSVGLVMSRTVDMMIGLLGVLKSGAAFVPIDPNYPAARIQYVLEDSGVNIVISDSSVAHGHLGIIKIIDLNEPAIVLEDDSDLPLQAMPSHLAYMIYTSGSTGKPKGVMVEHQNLISFEAGITKSVTFVKGGIWLALTTISFDIFILETIIPLINGASVVIASEQDQVDPHSIKSLILEHEVDMIQLTPSRLQLLLEDASLPVAFQRLKAIYIGGEALSLKLLKRLQSVTRAEIFNMYGPTETTIWSTTQNITTANRVTIGKPIANTQAYILNRNLCPTGVNIVGDLYIAGGTVSRGYRGKPELTDRSFVPCPFQPGQRMYRTGDLARWLPDGSMEYMGRSDFQVKIRGYRVELGEIEKILCEHVWIIEAVVIVVDAESLNPYLAAYYVGEGEIEAKELQLLLRKLLPEYMVPLVYTFMERWPLTPNGKLDRNSLPEPSINVSHPIGSPEPYAPIERQLWDIWRGLLRTEELGVSNNFFEMGGNSLAVVQVHKQLELLYPGTVRIADLFAYPTIVTLAGFIAERLEGPTHVTGFEHDRDYWLHELEGPILRLPPSYIQNGRPRDVEQLTLNYCMEIDEYTYLLHVAQQEGVDPIDILLAVYVHLLSQITGSMDIYLELLLPKPSGSRFCPLRVEMSRITNFSELFLLIHQKRKFASTHQGEDSFWRSKKREYWQEGNIIPLFGEQPSSSEIYLSEHELIHTISSLEGGIALRSNYNASYLYPDPVQRLIDDYQKLISMLLVEYAN